jgi:FtsH-binding integral membrane protein
MFTESVSVQTQTTTLNRYLAGVFGWMIVAMVISGLAALAVYSSTALQNIIYSSPIVYYGLFVGQILAVVLLSARAHKIGSVQAFLLFTLYSVLTGLTLSVILFAYAPKMIAGSFFMAAGVYGIMAIIGYTTKVNLSRFGIFFMMAVLGIIMVSVVNIFLQLSGLNLILSYVTLVVFAGLTAYDVQMVKEHYYAGLTGGSYMLRSALSLYIDFVNIFVSILNITSRD